MPAMTPTADPSLGRIAFDYWKRGLKYAPYGIAAAGALGYLGSRGEMEGIPAGMLGTIGGGTRGAFSGGILGSILGLGVAGAAVLHPGTRKWAAEQLGRALTHRTAVRTAMDISTSPLAVKMASMGRPELTYLAHLQTQWIGDAAIRGVEPHQMAMTHLLGILETKRAASLAVSAGIGAVAGGIVGAPLGAARKAYEAGIPLRQQ